MSAPSLSVSENLPVGPDRLDDALRAEVTTLIENTELVDIRPIRIVAELNHETTRPDEIAGTNFDVTLAYASGPGAFGNRFDYRFDLLGPEGEHRGRVEFTLVVDYEVREPQYQPGDEAADFFASTTGYLAAFPYARELFQSLTARMQFDPVVLGMLRRGTHVPRRTSSRRTRPA